jgi:hypothetical protein
MEDLLILLVFDEYNGKIVRNTVPEEYFEGFYFEVARRSYAYIDQFKTVPHQAIATLFDDILEGDDKNKAEIYRDILTRLYDSRDTVNPDFTLSRVHKFIEEQEFKSGIIQAAEVMQRGGDDSIEEAKRIMREHLSNSYEVFDPGIFLNETSKSLAFLDNTREAFPMGIPELDKRGLGPTPQELWMLIGVYGRGKTWSLINIGKRALLRRKKVCHVTLEMGADLTAWRYYQALFGLARRKDDVKITKFEYDTLDRLINFDTKTIAPNFSLDDQNFRKLIEDKVDDWYNFLGNLVVKQFPTGKLTIGQLEAYLDTLEASHNFKPDLLIVDYVDIMKINPSNYRIDLGMNTERLRGIAVERDIAVATVTQSNREGGKAKQVSGTNVAEDWSKMATVDVCITYSQTEKYEAPLGLARLYVDKARNDQAKFSVLISQSYSTGQFVIDSTLFQEQHHGLIEEYTED